MVLIIDAEGDEEEDEEEDELPVPWAEDCPAKNPQATTTAAKPARSVIPRETALTAGKINFLRIETLSFSGGGGIMRFNPAGWNPIIY